ncbi:hypothetical protein [Bradyrhizobium sp. B120]|uniref:hypothetical protein n=1 Tax=Bradyrhizobium sp. B120 TaxID=3410088 RepID=UPI003B97D4C8
MVTVHSIPDDQSSYDADSLGLRLPSESIECAVTGSAARVAPLAVLKRYPAEGPQPFRAAVRDRGSRASSSSAVFRSLNIQHLLCLQLTIRLNATQKMVAGIGKRTGDMAEFGRRQYDTTSIPSGAETPDRTKWLVWGAVAIALIAGSFLSYKAFYQSADPLLKHESFAEKLQRHASLQELRENYPSLDKRTIPIAFADRIYKIPRNYLVDLDRSSADPKETAFEIYVLLPNLEPRTANNAGRFAKSPFYDGYGDQVNARMRGGQEELDWSERRLLWNRRCEEKGSGAFRMVESGYQLCEAANSDLFLKDTPEGPLIFVCEKVTVKKPDCTIADRTGAGWGVLTLHFSRKYVYQADEIRKRFRSLLDSFAER